MRNTNDDVTINRMKIIKEANFNNELECKDYYLISDCRIRRYYLFWDHHIILTSISMCWGSSKCTGDHLDILRFIFMLGDHINVLGVVLVHWDNMRFCRTLCIIWTIPVLCLACIVCWLTDTKGLYSTSMRGQHFICNL